MRRMGRRLGLGVGLVGDDASPETTTAELPSCPDLARSLPRRMLRSRGRALAALLLLLLVVFTGLEEFLNVEQPECQCDTHECFMAHKEKALRGAVGRARRKCERRPLQRRQSSPAAIAPCGAT